MYFFIAYLSLATSDFHMYLCLFQTQYVEDNRETLTVRYMPHIELDKAQDTRTSALLCMHSCKELKIEKKYINHLDIYLDILFYYFILFRFLCRFLWIYNPL